MRQRLDEADALRQECASIDHRKPITLGETREGRQHVAPKRTANASAPMLSPARANLISCRETESNCRHADFQSAALPTELSRRRRRRSADDAGATIVRCAPSRKPQPRECREPASATSASAAARDGDDVGGSRRAPSAGLGQRPSAILAASTLEAARRRELASRGSPFAQGSSTSGAPAPRTPCRAAGAAPALSRARAASATATR